MHKKIEKFYIILYVNSSTDIDNTILNVKYFVDALKNLGIIKDDNKNYFQGLQITLDASLGKNTGILKVYGEWINA